MPILAALSPGSTSPGSTSFSFDHAERPGVDPVVGHRSVAASMLTEDEEPARAPWGIVVVAKRKEMSARNSRTGHGTPTVLGLETAVDPPGHVIRHDVQQGTFRNDAPIGKRRVSKVTIDQNHLLDASGRRDVEEPNANSTTPLEVTGVAEIEGWKPVIQRRRAAPRPSRIRHPRRSPCHSHHIRTPGPRRGRSRRVETGDQSPQLPSGSRSKIFDCRHDGRCPLPGPRTADARSAGVGGRGHGGAPNTWEGSSTSQSFAPSPGWEPPPQLSGQGSSSGGGTG